MEKERDKQLRYVLLLNRVEERILQTILSREKETTTNFIKKNIEQILKRLAAAAPE